MYGRVQCTRILWLHYVFCFTSKFKYKFRRLPFDRRTTSIFYFTENRKSRPVETNTTNTDGRRRKNKMLYSHRWPLQRILIISFRPKEYSFILFSGSMTSNCYFYILFYPFYWYAHRLFPIMPNKSKRILCASYEYQLIRLNS